VVAPISKSVFKPQVPNVLNPIVVKQVPLPKLKQIFKTNPIFKENKIFTAPKQIPKDIKQLKVFKIEKGKDNKNVKRSIWVEKSKIFPVLKSYSHGPKMVWVPKSL